MSIDDPNYTGQPDNLGNMTLSSSGLDLIREALENAAQAHPCPLYTEALAAFQAETGLGPAQTAQLPMTPITDWRPARGPGGPYKGPLAPGDSDGWPAEGCKFLGHLDCSARKGSLRCSMTARHMGRAPHRDPATGQDWDFP